MARLGGRDRGLFQRHRADGKLVWGVRIAVHGRLRKFSPFATKVEATDFRDQARTEQRQRRFFPDRYRKGAGISLAHSIHHHLGTTTKKSKRDDKRFGAFWQARFPSATLDLITPISIMEAKAALEAKGCAPQTVAHYLKFLRHVLNLAVRNGDLDRNPCQGVAFPKLPLGVIRYLSFDEERRLFKAIGGRYTRLVRLALLTGLRQAEQFRLKWDFVDLKRAMLTIPETKSGQVRHVPLSREAVRILKGLPRPTAWVFHGKQQRGPMDTHNFYNRVFLPAVSRAKLENVTWHTLRHTFASRAIMAGVSLAALKELLGHASIRMVLRYAHLEPGHLKAAVEKVGSYRETEPEIAPARKHLTRKSS